LNFAGSWPNHCRRSFEGPTSLSHSSRAAASLLTPRGQMRSTRTRKPSPSAGSSRTDLMCTWVVVAMSGPYSPGTTRPEPGTRHRDRREEPRRGPDPQPRGADRLHEREGVRPADVHAGDGVHAEGEDDAP